MKALKLFFLNRLMREKVLLLGFALLAAATWFSSAAGRLVRFGRGFSETSKLMSAQKKLLADRTKIEAKAQRAAAQLDPSRTLDSARLQGELNTLAAGLPNVTIDARPSQQTDQFAVNSVQFSVRKVSWEALLRFYVELSKHSPYISIEQCSVVADRANPAQLDATMQIFSVEIAR
ncbi:MAG: hypothetical protein KGJ37_00235 [Verrucomicrobiota bacterium]|nr:hypothetical protein [Verrucomicrobiota bacterium]